MRLSIGPYELIQRTEYSKVKISRKDSIEIENEDALIEEILNDYYKQLPSENFFRIEDGVLKGFSKLKRHQDIKYLFIPEGVIAIDERAFEKTTFEYVSLPSTLKSIGEYAFYLNNKLREIDIPDTVFKIGPGAFEGCLNLKHIKLPNLERISNRLFYECVSLQRVDLPDTIIAIDNSAFYKCASLSNINFPDALEHIAPSAFEKCISLTKLNLPENLVSIGGGAFKKCGLEEMKTPDGIRLIGPNIFTDCENLRSVDFPKNIKAVPNEMFLYCTNLKNVELPDTIQAFGSHIFAGTCTLQNIDIPRDLSSISYEPFYGSSVESLTFNYDLKTLEAYGSNFLESSSIKKIIINENVKIISPKAFGKDGAQIKKIEYLGSKENFEEFKKNNPRLFDILPNASVDIIEKTKEKNIEELTK